MKVKKAKEGILRDKNGRITTEETSSSSDDDDVVDDGNNAEEYDEDGDKEEEEREKTTTSKNESKTKKNKQIKLFSKVYPYCLAGKEYSTKLTPDEKLAFLSHVYKEHYQVNGDDYELTEEQLNKVIQEDDFMEAIEWALNDPDRVFTYIDEDGRKEKAMMHFYHESMTFEEIKDHTYFHHLDYRPHCEYKRVSHEKYRAFASEGKLSFKAVWNFDLLGYARIDIHICYDPMHGAKNIGYSVIENLCGERIKPKSARFCESIRTHPTLYQEEADPKTVAELKNNNRNSKKKKPKNLNKRDRNCIKKLLKCKI